MAPRALPAHFVLRDRLTAMLVSPRPDRSKVGCQDARHRRAMARLQSAETLREEATTPAIDVVAITRSIVHSSIVEYDAPSRLTAVLIDLAGLCASVPAIFKDMKRSSRG